MDKNKYEIYPNSWSFSNDLLNNIQSNIRFNFVTAKVHELTKRK